MTHLYRAAGLVAIALALSACDQLSSKSPPVTPPPGPGALQDRTLGLGLSTQQKVNVPFGGSWRVTDYPDWVKVSQQGGTGAVSFTLTADRQQATPVAADQASLSGVIKVSWTAGEGSAAQNGTASWTVTAQQYELTGRAALPAQVTGTDLVTSAARPAAGTVAPRGVIVKYRSGALGTQGAEPATGTSARTAPGQGGASRAVALGAQRLTGAGLTVTRRAPLGERSAALDVRDVPAALAALRADPNVEYAVPNVVLHTQATLAQPVTPADQFAPLQWAYPLLGYGAVWRDMEAGGYTRAITVAVVDSGVRFDHPDLQGQLWQPGEGALDVLTDPQNGDGDGADTDATDPATPGRTGGSHGTHVSGIIAARWGTNAGVCAGCSPSGVVGASYKANVKVLPVRVIDASGNATSEDVALGIRYAAGLPVVIGGTTYRTAHAAQVINLSLGGEVSADEARPMCEAIADARAAGALVVAAAGNGYGTAPYYPAACEGAVSVASVTLSGASAPMHSPFSNAYPQVQLAAPGGADPYSGAKFNGGTFNGAAFPDMILSTSWDYSKNVPNYEAEVGTSQASPQVAALAALMLSKGVTTGADDTLARLRETATDLGAAGRDNLFGFGMINAAAALNAPAVSDAFGLRVQSSRGLSFQPKLDSTGAFRAYLGDGTYRVTAGTDANGNGVYGESGETRDERSAALAEATPKVELGTLIPR
ncbi:serine protease [Deinococcus arenae]|uniref:Serine protease n=1 Tax=Deinococcus arenae TaxID=1452751 RepID=A0A8H9GJ58_9DEIO|nr:S8 family serine peptidase [Deinococcus arenae]AWT35684.1 serine protease [Deinococcus actinosclerus]GGM32734.1 serine protease [Deinococcus arenae]